MDYISAGEAAKRWNLSVRRVQKLCEQGRIKGVLRFGRSWQIPARGRREARRPAAGEAKGERPFRRL